MCKQEDLAKLVEPVMPTGIILKRKYMTEEQSTQEVIGILAWLTYKYVGCLVGDERCRRNVTERRELWKWMSCDDITYIVMVLYIYRAWWMGGSGRTGESASGEASKNYLPTEQGQVFYMTVKAKIIGMLAERTQKQKWNQEYYNLLDGSEGQDRKKRKCNERIRRKRTQVVNQEWDFLDDLEGRKKQHVRL